MDKWLIHLYVWLGGDHFEKESSSKPIRSIDSHLRMDETSATTVKGGNRSMQIQYSQFLSQSVSCRTVSSGETLQIASTHLRFNHPEWLANQTCVSCRGMWAAIIRPANRAAATVMQAHHKANDWRANAIFPLCSRAKGKRHRNRLLFHSNSDVYVYLLRISYVMRIISFA